MISPDLRAAAQDRVHDQNDKCNNCRGQRNADIGAEFILHLHTLRLGRSNGCIRNKREIISEHRASDDNTHTERQQEVSVLRYLACDRSKNRNCPDACSHRHGDQAGDHEQSGHRKTSRYDTQQQIRCAGGSSCLSGDAAERACQNKNEQHGDNIVIADSFRTDVNLLIKRTTGILDKRGNQRN